MRVRSAFSKKINDKFREKSIVEIYKTSLFSVPVIYWGILATFERIHLLALHKCRYEYKCQYKWDYFSKGFTSLSYIKAVMNINDFINEIIVFLHKFDICCAKFSSIVKNNQASFIDQ